MRLFEVWRQVCLSARGKDTPEPRVAFQAGARHVLTSLIEHLDGTDEATAIALKINDEIHDFATVALLDQRRQ